MGGNALNKTFTRRYEKDEYFELSAEVVDEVFWELDSGQAVAIPAYREKETFGDLDILYTTDVDIPFSVDVIQKAFEPNQIVRNSEVISFDYKEFQVDLIHIHQEHFEYGLKYFSYNDCGNLVGKLAHQLGLKHGHKGLVLPLRDGNNKFADIVLTLDHDKTLELLGLDVDQFNSGFNNLEEIFNFISGSRYYNPEHYKLENLNSIAKIRDRKRDTYNKFLAFGENWTGPVSERSKDKSSYLHYIFDFFPEAYPAYKKAIVDLTFQRAVKEKFSGDLVSAWTGFGGKILGEFMSELRKNWYFQSENIMYLDLEKIKSMVIDISVRFDKSVK